MPVLFPALRMPITLHRGMNQIQLVVTGAMPSQVAQPTLSDLHIRR